MSFVKSISQFRVLFQSPDLAAVYLFEVNNGTIRVMCEMPSKFTIKTAEHH